MQVYTFPFPLFESDPEYQYTKVVVQHKISQMLKHFWATALVATSIGALAITAGLTIPAVLLCLLWAFGIYMGM